MTEKRRERGGSNQWERGVWASERKQNFFTAAQRQNVWFKLCAMDVRGTLRRKLSRRLQPIGRSGWISGKVGRKVMSSKDGTFPWQPNLTVVINCNWQANNMRGRRQNNAQTQRLTTASKRRNTQTFPVTSRSGRSVPILYSKGRSSDTTLSKC